MTDTKKLHVKDVDGVGATLTVGHDGPISATIWLSTPERVEEFRTLMQRALNTYADYKPWMYELSDALNAKLPL